MIYWFRIHLFIIQTWPFKFKKHGFKTKKMKCSPFQICLKDNSGILNIKPPSWFV